MTPEKVGDKLRSRIESGVPVPIRRGLLMNEFHDVLAAMKVKESILCEDQEVNRCQFAINTVHRAKTGKRYTGRQISKTKKRFWRIE